MDAMNVIPTFWTLLSKSSNLIRLCHAYEPFHTVICYEALKNTTGRALFQTRYLCLSAHLLAAPMHGLAELMAWSLELLERHRFGESEGQIISATTHLHQSRVLLQHRL